MRILIIGANDEKLAAAARLRRLDEAAKIILAHEAADSPEAEHFRRRYRIDMRPYTRFVSADMGYSNVATLEDVLTQHIYQEEFDRIINIEPHSANLAIADIDRASLDYYFDADAAAHIAHHVPENTQISIRHINGAGGVGRHIADEIYGRTRQAKTSIKMQAADFGNIVLVWLGATEKGLNAQQVPHMYSILPIPHGFLKLLYDDAGSILGFAALGQSPIAENCADMMMTLVKMGGNIQHMAHLELAGSGNPLQILGKIAQNVVEKRLYIAYADEIGQLARSEVILLDVRHSHEFMVHYINGSVNIPLDILRESIYRLEHHKEIITICGDGKESYLAARILMGHGFKTRHLAGGLAYAMPIIASY
ncbi:MAG: hypothetical protein LBE55_07405 [Clostridiales bacterium]|nr:hypothetical protein [Clostridiales bacterium]